MGAAAEETLPEQEAGAVFVQAIAQKGLQQVPARFLQHKSPVTAQDEREVPTIDLGKLFEGKDDTEMAKLAAACKDWGFFQVMNHGVPIPLLQAARESSRHFFQMPQEDKLKYSIKPGGSEGYGRHFLVSEDVVLDWVDLLYYHLQPASARDLSLWPTSPENYRVTMEEYSSQVFLVAKKLLSKISETLGMESSFLEQRFGFNQTIRINYYPPCPQPDLVMGLSPHSDPGGITLLLQDDVEGLQVRKNGQWIQVKACPEAFVVNIADQIEVITNGRYKSVEHRAVVTSQNRARISLATFHSPSPDALISPAAEFEDGGYRYSPMTFQEYKSSFLNKELRGKSHVNSRRSTGSAT